MAVRDGAQLDVPQGGSADRLIAATAVSNGAELVTSDERPRSSRTVKTLW